jgi:tetratricopeptide (TPR) repeat protein
MIGMSFMEHLATAQSDAEFARTAAGFTLLQIYDSVKTNGVTSFQLDAIQKVEHDLADLDLAPKVRAALGAMICAMPFWESGGPVRVGRKATYTSLLMYGDALGSEGEWRLAESVFALAGMDTELDGETWLSAESRLLMGRAARMCADWDTAQVAYHRAAQLGREAGDCSIVFRAQIGEANLLWSRGNLQTAQLRLASLARRAKQSCPSVVPRVTLALAGVANMTGEYEKAISLAFGILDAVDDDDELRYQTLVDLASFLTDYGLPSVASNALRLVQRSAPDRHVRRHATLNLLFLASRHEDAAEFDALRTALADERLTTRQQAQFALFTAQGYHRFGRLAEARVAAERAVHLANKYQHFQLVFEAEAELSDILQTLTRAPHTRSSHSLPRHSMTLAVSEDVTPNPSTAAVAIDSIPPGIRRVVDSLASMAADSDLAMSVAG